jgi:Acyltransferase
MPRYPFPWDLFCRLALQLPSGSRSLTADAALMSSRISPPPVVEGVDRIPVEGPLVVAANHYQRRGLWIAWPGTVITTELAMRRGQEPPIHWLVTGGIRLFQWKHAGPEVPFSSTMMVAIARIYGMIPLPLDKRIGRATALRTWIRLAESGHAVGLFPEGLAGSSRGLRHPEPGFDALCNALHTRRIPVIPCAIFERGDTLHIRFGPCVTDLSDPEAPGDHVMRAISSLLPPSQRGEYPLTIETSATPPGNR